MRLSRRWRRWRRSLPAARLARLVGCLAAALAAGCALGRRAPEGPARASQEAREKVGLRSAPATARYHVVAPGETAGRIARQYGVSLAALIRANHLGDGNRIEAGQRLRIPRERPRPWVVEQRRR